MNPRFGLTESDIELIQNVFKKNPLIEKVILYGSRAKGNFKNGSDIDLTILAPQMDLSDLFKIENQIDDLNLPYKMDLSLIHQIENQNLIEHIDRVGQVFYLKSSEP